MISQKNRSGYSKITSVSVSNEMIKLIEQYNLSPTEVFRRGMGVSLHDLGISPYCNSTMNKERSEYVRKFILSLENEEELGKFNHQIEQIKKFNAAIKRLKKDISNVNTAVMEFRSFD